MNAGLIGSIAIGAVTAVVALAAFILSARAAKVQATAAIKGVDAQAYERARGLYESSIKGLQDETSRLEGQVKNLRAEVARVHDQAGQLQGEVRRLRASNEALRAELAVLRDR